mmetsp:Transcript_11482/g.16159  ORF Transcript_11482/g.16159 Transcript_11482/m.16159 type:complete len:113 (-) Transcript_11482:3449-3787(-)
MLDPLGCRNAEEDDRVTLEMLGCLACENERSESISQFLNVRVFSAAISNLAADLSNLSITDKALVMAPDIEDRLQRDSGKCISDLSSSVNTTCFDEDASQSDDGNSGFSIEI